MDIYKTIIEKVLNFPADYLWGVLALVIFVFLILSAVFHYHWNHYGVNKNAKTVAQSLFWIFSLILIITMTISIFIFESQT